MMRNVSRRGAAHALQASVSGAAASAIAHVQRFATPQCRGHAAAACLAVSTAPWRCRQHVAGAACQCAQLPSWSRRLHQPPRPHLAHRWGQRGPGRAAWPSTRSVHAASMQRQQSPRTSPALACRSSMPVLQASERTAQAAAAAAVPQLSDLHAGRGGWVGRHRPPTPAPAAPADQGPVCTLTHGHAACRWSAHRPVQLAVRQEDGRQVCPAVRRRAAPASSRRFSHASATVKAVRCV